jgi:hypothetical protein
VAYSIGGRIRPPQVQEEWVAPREGMPPLGVLE